MRIIVALVLLVGLLGCQSKEPPQKAEEKAKPVAETAGDTQPAPSAADVVPVAQPLPEQSEEVVEPTPQPPAIDNSCPALIQTTLTPVLAFLERMGFEQDAARQALLAANQVDFVEACEKLDEKQRSCLASGTHVMAAVEGCGVKELLKWNWPDELVKSFERPKLDDTAQAERLQKMVGTWVAQKQPGWEETWVISASGTATLERKQGENPPRLTEYAALSFPDEATMGVKSGNSTQFVPLYNAGERIFVYFNTANYHYPVPDEQRFVIDMYQRYLAYEPGSCQVLDTKTAIVYAASCQWEDKDGERYFTYGYQSLAGWPSGQVSDSWLKVDQRLLDPWLARSMYVKQAGTVDATPEP